MKQITKKSAEKKLANLTVKSATNPLPLSKSSVVYKSVREVFEGKGYIRPCYSTGSGRWTRNQDHSFLIENTLKQIGIEFTCSNDSPRGGVTGKLIVITTKVK